MPFWGNITTRTWCCFDETSPDPQDMLDPILFVKGARVRTCHTSKYISHSEQQVTSALTTPGAAATTTRTAATTTHTYIYSISNMGRFQFIYSIHVHWLRFAVLQLNSEEGTIPFDSIFAGLANQGSLVSLGSF